MYLVTVIFLSVCIATSIGQRMYQISSAYETALYVAQKEQRLRCGEAIMLYAQKLWLSDPTLAEKVRVAGRYTIACNPAWEDPHVQAHITYEKVPEPRRVAITIQISGDFGQEQLVYTMACPEKGF